MVNISTILAVLFCATAPVATVVDVTPNKEAIESNFQLGQKTVSEIRKAYENGSYNQFLTEMNESYKTSDMSSLVQMRKDTEIKGDLLAKWESQMLLLQKEKGQALLASLKDDDDSLFAQKVRSHAATLMGPEQEKAFLKLNSFINMAPGSGSNADENALIDLDIEYEYKLLHLPNQEISSQEKLAGQIALRMEKMDKMVQASKNFQDQNLIQAVGIAADTFDARLAKNLDATDLKELVKEGKPANATEEKVFSVLTHYQGKFSDLMKEITNTVN